MFFKIWCWYIQEIYLSFIQQNIVKIVNQKETHVIQRKSYRVLLRNQETLDISLKKKKVWGLGLLAHLSVVTL